MLFVTKRETAFRLKKVNMLYLGYVLLPYVLIFYHLEVSFNFHFKFLQLNVIKMFIVIKVKSGFSVTSGYLLRAPDKSKFF